MEDKLKVYVVIAIGLTAIGYALVLWRRLKRCSSWPSTDGTIIRSEKIVTRHHLQRLQKVTVRYTYFVGCRHESETVKVGGFMHIRKRDEEVLLARYPLGATVPVFYDPNRPNVACLEKRGMDSILCIGGYGCVAVAIGLLLYFFR